MPESRSCARILLYANANLLLTESFHGNKEKIGWTQIGRAIQLRKEVFRKKVVRTEVIEPRCVEAQLFREKVRGKKIHLAQVSGAEVFR